MMLLRSLVLLVCVVSVANAAPCKSIAACTAACDAGNPASCIAATDSDFQPLSADKLTAEDRKATDCSDVSLRCSRFAAHLWAGIGVKVNRAAAIALWEDACTNYGADWRFCLAYGKAIEKTKPTDAAELYRTMCDDHDIELGCRAAARLWTRVSGVVGGTKFSVELPAVMRHIEPWSTGSWHVTWSSSMKRPDVEISAGLTCKAGPQSAGSTTGRFGDMNAKFEAKYERLPANWANRICKSVRGE